MPWISAADRAHFKKYGYLVVKNVVPPHLLQPACEEIAAAVQADLNDPSTWYQGDVRNDGIVPVHHLQSLWNIRQNPQVFSMFAEFWGQDTHLYTDINRCCFRPPVHDDYPAFSLGEIHFDIDPRKGSEGWIQGIVLLTDIAPHTGGFQCIPEIYQDIDEWVRQHAMSVKFNHFQPGLEAHPTVQISGRAGDVILWSTLLPHGPAINLSDQVRIAAFLTITPDKKIEQKRLAMQNWVKHKRAPDKWRGLPQQQDPEPGPPVALTELGEKLAGIRSW